MARLLQVLLAAVPFLQPSLSLLSTGSISVMSSVALRLALPVRRGCSVGQLRRHFCAQQLAVAPVTQPVIHENFRNGSQELRIWESTSGALVAQHDEVEDIDACKWTLERARHHVLAFGTKNLNKSSPKDVHNTLMVLRFLHDLETRIEELRHEDLGTVAVELFERPWVLSRSSSWGRATEVLQLRPRPDSLARRAVMAAISPVVAPVGALSTYFKAGSANSLAACKWYFRAVTDFPCRVQLDQCYLVVEGDYTSMAEAAASGIDVCRFVHGFLPHFRSTKTSMVIDVK